MKKKSTVFCWTIGKFVGELIWFWSIMSVPWKRFYNIIYFHINWTHCCYKCKTTNKFIKFFGIISFASSSHCLKKMLVRNSIIKVENHFFCSTRKLPSLSHIHSIMIMKETDLDIFTHFEPPPPVTWKSDFWNAVYMYGYISYRHPNGWIDCICIWYLRFCLS